MINLDDIRGTIVSGQLTNEELTQISEALTFARAQLARKNTGAFVNGTNVKFTHSKTRREFHGKVIKVKLKKILIDCGSDGRWDVPASMVTRWETV